MNFESNKNIQCKTNLYSSRTLSQRSSMPTMAMKPRPTMSATPTTIPSSKAARTVCSPDKNTKLFFFQIVNTRDVRFQSYEGSKVLNKNKECELEIGSDQFSLKLNRLQYKSSLNYFQLLRQKFITCIWMYLYCALYVTLNFICLTNALKFHFSFNDLSPNIFT